MPGGRTAYVTLPDARLSLPGFEGPLELLLHLLDEGELAITAVSLATITDQYLGVLALLPPSSSRLDYLAEFLVVGARLLVLKSRALLPREANRATGEDELDETTLAERLVEYRRYREAAARLRQRQERGARAFARRAPPPLPPPASPARLQGATPDALAAALQRLLAARRPSPAPDLPPRVSLAERIAEVRAAVAAQRQVGFTWLAAGCATRADLIVTFLAILELFRRRVVRLQQDTLFGEIWLTAVAGSSAVEIVQTVSEP
jgi:segregation and condensation protein A